MRSYSEQVRRYLVVGNYSPHTIRSYVSQVRHALDQIGRPAERWTAEDIRQYLYYLRTERRCSSTTLNQAYSAIKILQVRVLGRSWDGLTLPRARQHERLPQVLSVEEVKLLLAALSNEKHRVILQLLYTSGLRLGELIQLKLTDIDSKRMQVRVEQGKGRKDRYTLLSQKTLEARTGMLAVLHTWGQNLRLHPHVHAIVPAGGLSVDENRWVAPRRGSFFVPVRVLSALFRGKFLAGLRSAYGTRQLRFSEPTAHLGVASAFHAFYRSLYDQSWVVYAKRPFGGPAQVLRYLGRYTHRVAISNARVEAISENGVTFRYKDYRHDIGPWS